VRERDVELSELRIAAADAAHAAQQERERASEAEHYYEVKITQVRTLD